MPLLVKIAIAFTLVKHVYRWKHAWNNILVHYSCIIRVFVHLNRGNFFNFLYSFGMDHIPKFVKASILKTACNNYHIRLFLKRWSPSMEWRMNPDIWLNWCIVKPVPFLENNSLFLKNNLNINCTWFVLLFFYNG